MKAPRLVKEICKRCMDESAKENGGEGWNKAHGDLWVKRRRVRCPYEWSSHNLTIPEDCRHRLEHLVSQ